MKLNIFYLIPFILLTACSGKTVKDPHASFFVGKNSALFKIPIETKENFEWYSTNTRDNALEFGSNIKVENFNFGFSLFKPPNSEPKSGSISKLLQSGQFSIWETSDGGGSIIDNHSIQIDFNAPYLEIKIDNPETINLLFGTKPVSGFVTIEGFKPLLKQSTVTIEYSEL